MEKRTNLFGWDITPRRELWQDIRRLYKQLEIQECHLADKQKENDGLTAQNRSLTAQLSELHDGLAEAQEANNRLSAENARLTTENAGLRRTSCKRRTNTKKQPS